MRDTARTPILDSPVRDAPNDHELLVEYLESDQLVQERARPVGRARLSERAAAGLWALRVFAIILAVMVIYTFVAHL